VVGFYAVYHYEYGLGAELELVFTVAAFVVFWSDVRCKILLYSTCCEESAALPESS
jgi:hypothetical protein